MKVFLIFCIALLGFSQSYSQCAPICNKVDFLDNWDDDSLYPISQPEGHFSDIWAYVDGSGNEYGIIGGRDSIFIVDVTDPLDISRVAGIYQGDTSLWRDFKVYGDYLYSVVDAQGSFLNDRGVVIYDLSNLPAVTRVKELNSEFGNCHNIFIDVPNDRLYAAGFNGSQQNASPDDVCIYDLSSDPANPVLLDCVNLDAIAPGALEFFYFHDIFVRDNIVYGSHGNSGYYIWDMTDISNITLLGSIDNSNFDVGYVHSSWNSDDNSRAIVATENGDDPKLYWIDQSDPSDISVLDRFKKPLCVDAGNTDKKRPHNPFIIGEKIYVSNYEDGFNILEIDFAQDTIGRFGYFDTYPDNTNYAAGFRGNWGAYPFLPSGTLLASDRKYGLFTLKVSTGPSEYRFLGSISSDWFNAANWEGNLTPPDKFCGKIIIESNCETGGGLTFCSGTEIIVRNNSSFYN